MAIGSLGIGSGLALNDLVTQLLNAERQGPQTRFEQRRETFDAQISGLGKLRSKMDDFKTTLKELRSDRDINARKPVANHPNYTPSEDTVNEVGNVFKADATTSASSGKYEIAITELAKGSRLTSADGAFSSSSDSVLSSGTGTLDFNIAGKGLSFSVNITPDMTLEDIKNAVNSSAGNEEGDDKNPFVNASIINTGTAVGAKLVFSSSITGSGNDLVISNTSSDGLSDLDALSTTGMNVTSATNARATIDGLEVSSGENKFENVIENVSFTAQEISPKDSNGDYLSSRLTIGLDEQSLKGKVENFVSKYNELVSELDTLTSYGSSELQEDGILAGDSMARGVRDGLTSILGSGVSGSKLGTLFAAGISFTDEGKLEISSTDQFGAGSGIERLEEALEDNFDEVANLFTSDNGGVANKLFDFVDQYVQFGGLLRTRESAVQDQKRSLDVDVASFEERMFRREETLKSRYSALDLSIARMSRTQNALMASIGF